MLGVTRQGIQYRINNNAVDIKTIHDLLVDHGLEDVNMDWLLLGRGDKFVDRALLPDVDLDLLRSAKSMIEDYIEHCEQNGKE